MSFFVSSSLRRHQRNHTGGLFSVPNVTRISPNLVTKRNTKKPFSPFPAPGVTCLSPCLESSKEILEKTYRGQSLCHLFVCNHSSNLDTQIPTRLSILGMSPLPASGVTKASHSLVA